MVWGKNSYSNAVTNQWKTATVYTDNYNKQFHKHDKQTDAQETQHTDATHQIMTINEKNV